MIRFFHNYQKSVVGLLFLLIIAVAMLVFGLPTDGGQRNAYAIKVNSEEISMRDVTLRIQNERTRLRSMFGPAYDNLSSEFEAELVSDVVDSIIAERLFAQTATQLGLRGGDRHLSSFVEEQMGGFDPVRYRSLLLQLGKTATQFENELSEELAASSLRQIVQDTSLASKQEWTALWKEQNIMFDLDYAEIPLEAFLPSEEPTSEQLMEFYNSKITNYEIPAQVRYDFAAIPTGLFSSELEIRDEDIELYYQDNQRNYRIPEKRLITRLTIPEQRDAQEFKQKVEEFLAKNLTSNEAVIDKDALASELDIDTAMIEDPEWVSRGELTAEEEIVLFQTQEAPKLVETVSEKNNSVLVLIDIEEESYRTLEEVREDIKKSITEREAPAFEAAYAQDLLKEWGNSSDSLEDFAKKSDLSYTNPDQLFTREEDPNNFQGLTEQVFRVASEGRTVIRHNDKNYLVEISEFKQPYFQEFEEVKEQVKEQYLNDATSSNAIEFANNIANSTDATVAEELLKQKEVELKSSEALTRDSLSAPLSLPELRSQVLSLLPAEGWITKPVINEKTVSIARVHSIRYPENGPSEKEQVELMTLAERQLASETELAILARLKRLADIDINPAALN